MVNAVLVPLLLLLVGGCLYRMDPGRERGTWVALTGLALILASPVLSREIWQLVLPFRDAASHVAGMGALLWVMRALETPPGSRAVWRFVVAALLVALSGGCRLSGFLFVAPAGALMLCWPSSGWRMRQRWQGLLWAVLLCVLLGLGMIVVQNLTANRSLFALPQADALFWREDTVNAGSAVRKGWHPANIPLIAPWLRATVRAAFPGWGYWVLLGGTLGWLVSAKSRWQRLAPWLVAWGVFFLFYAAYDKVVGRYACMIMLIEALILALGGGWLLELIVRGLRRGCPRLGAVPRGVAIAGLTGAIAIAAIRSGGDGVRAQAEWRDARRFKTWLHATLPPSSSVYVARQDLYVWTRYFRPETRFWFIPFGLDDMPDAKALTLPDVPPYVLISFSSAPEDLDRGWSWDLLLNRFDVEPAGVPLNFENGGGVRLYRVNPRQSRQREVAVRTTAQEADRLLLYLRDWPDAPEGALVQLRTDTAREPWGVRLHGGLNLLTVPSTWRQRPETLLLVAEEPLPTVIDAAWMAVADPVAIDFSRADMLGASLAQVDLARIHWRGYEFWNRDWGGYRPDLQSRPQFFFSMQGARLRLPAYAPGAGDAPRLLVRLFYSALAQERSAVDALMRMGYRDGAASYEPLAVMYNPYYSNAHFPHIADFMHELVLESTPSDAHSRWLAAAIPSELRDEPDALLFLHRMEIQLADWPAGTKVGRNPHFI
jgi:hypothetical protein